MVTPHDRPATGAPAQGTSEATLAAVLAEAPWIRRLATDLVGDGCEADDLAQDVLVAALDQRPRLEPRSVRAWLRTVARRLAGRRRRRAAARARVEAIVARPEAEEDGALRRLALHRELLSAIESLENQQRTALTLRYLEGLPPRRIAERLGVSSAAARKRVSRGLAALRERMDASHGGKRAQWAMPLARLLAPPPSSPGPRAAHRGSEAPALSSPLANAIPLTILTSKLWPALLALAATTGWLLWIRTSEPASPVGESIGVAQPAPLPTKAAAEPHPIGASPSAPGARDERRPVVGSLEAAMRTEPRVSVVLAHGGVPRDANVAWVDARDAAYGLELDETASAIRPPGSAGARFFAHSPSGGAAVLRAGPADEAVELVLEPHEVLRGRIVEDGGLPARSLPLVAHVSARVPELLAMDRRLRGELEALGAVSGSLVIWTRADGSFRSDALPAGCGGSLVLPTTHRPIVGGVPSADAAVAIGSDEGELSIETLRLPSVHGRLEWEGEGVPFEGVVTIVYEDRATGSCMMTYARSDSSGSFAIGLPVEERALRADPVDRAEALLHRALRIGIEQSKGVAPFEHRVELMGQPFPIELGVLHVPRARELALRVLGFEGEPVTGAAVVTGIEETRTDERGEARLSCVSGDEVQVLATGHAFAAFDADGLASGGAPVELHLLPGSTLELQLTAVVEAAPAPWQKVRLRWEESPFGGAHVRGDPPYSPYSPRLLRALHGRPVIGARFRNEEGAPGSVTFSVGADGALILPGLRAGSAFRVEVVDELDQELHGAAVEMPALPGMHRVALPTLPENPVRLRLQVFGEDGAGIEHATVFVSSLDGKRGASFDAPGGSLDLGPLAPGTYSLKVRAAGYLERPMQVEAVDRLTDPQAVLLARARELRVEVVDTSGEPIAFRSLSLDSTEGWSVEAGDGALGVEVFRSVPLDALTATLQVGTRRYVEAIGARSEVGRIVLPEHGVLEVRSLRPPSLRFEDGRLRTRILETAGEGELELGIWFQVLAVGPLTLETPLLPGDYRLEVDLVERPEDVHEGEAPYVRALDRRELTIRPGERARVEL